MGLFESTQACPGRSLSPILDFSSQKLFRRNSANNNHVMEGLKVQPRRKWPLLKPVILANFLSIYAAQKWMSTPSAPGLMIDNGNLHVLCRRPDDLTSKRRLFVLHHSETGSSLQLADLDGAIDEENAAVCAFDRPGYGWSSEKANILDLKAKLDSSRSIIHIGYGAGAVSALEMARGTTAEVILVEPILPSSLSVSEFALDYRVWLNRPLDNDRLLQATGLARFLRSFGAWGPFYRPSCRDPLNFELVVSSSHASKIRNVLWTEMWDLLQHSDVNKDLVRVTRLIIAGDGNEIDNSEMRSLLRAHARTVLNNATRVTVVAGHGFENVLCGIKVLTD